jgi:hypothetical protein
VSPPICPAPDAIACVVSGSGRAASSCSVTVTPGCDTSITGVSTSTRANMITIGRATPVTGVTDAHSVYTTRVADESTYAAIIVGTTIVAGCPHDRHRRLLHVRLLLSLTDAIVATDSTCPADVATPTNDRSVACRATLFFDASARGVLNRLALQEIWT